jgi:hypothetical protein
MASAQTSTASNDAPTAWLVGQRVRTAHHGFLFDAEALPRLRVTGTGPFRVRWQPAWGPPVPLGSTERTVQGATLVQVEDLAGVPLGEGELLLLGPAAQVRMRWSVQHTFTPPLPAPEPIGQFADFVTKTTKPNAHIEAATVWRATGFARALQTAGRSTDAQAAWQHAAALAERIGWLSEAGRGLRAAAYVAERARRYTEAETLLDAAVRLSDPTADPLGEARLAYARGLLAQQVGDLRGARAALTEAADTFAAYGETGAHATVTEALALLHSDLGAHATARALVRGSAAPPADADAETRSRHLHNRAWIDLRGASEGAWPLDAAAVRADLAAAHALYATTGEVEAEADARASLAWVALQSGDAEGAAAQVAAVRALDAATARNARRFVDLIEAEVWLARGDAAQALVLFARLEAVARAEVGDRVADLAWRARFGQGRAAQAGHDPETALAHFEVALAEVATLARQTALHDDRGHLLAGRQALVESTVGLLLDRGDTARAFAVADAARARVLSAFATRARLAHLRPAARAQWQAAVSAVRDSRAHLATLQAQAEQVPTDALEAWRQRRDAAEAETRATLEAAVLRLDGLAPPLAAGTLDGAQATLPEAGALVAFAPTPEGYTAFVLRPKTGTDSGVRTRAVPASGDPWPALADLLSGVRILTVVPGGQPQAVAGLSREAADGGEPWFARAQVNVLPVVGLALGTIGTPDGPPLVVDDAYEDLPWARREGAAVAARFADARRLSGTQARRDAVLPALAKARLVHFAGHGVLRPEDPWSAHLALTGGDRLDLGDLLATPLVGAVVVLAGCDTGVDAVLSSNEIIGLPEALVAAGARAVVATDRPLPDATGRRFAEAFYAAGGDRHPAAGVLAAAKALRAAGDPHWSAFRTVGRR